MPQGQVLGQQSLDDFKLTQVDVRLVLKEGNPFYSTQSMNGPRQAVEVMRDAMKDLDREMVCVVNMDNKLRPINYNVVSIGGVNESVVPMQNVFKSAILSNAGNVMLLHNHPSGEVTPSKEDRIVTDRLVQAGNLMNIPVLDHIIIGGGTGAIYSFREDHPDLFDGRINMDEIKQMTGKGVREMANTYDERTNGQGPERLDPETEKAMAAFLTDYSQAKNALFVRIRNSASGDERVADAPHKDIEDLTMTYHVKVQIPGEDGIASTLVTNSLLEQYGITPAQLHEDAMRNSQEMMPMKFAPMATILFGVPEEVAMQDGQLPMMVMTNEEKMFGASALFYPEAMDQLAEKMGGNYFVLPSSVHEVIVIPNDGNSNVKDLEQMVHEVNSTQVDPKEQLSDRVYHYDAKEHTFELAENYEKRMKEKAQENGKEDRSEKQSLRDRLSAKKEESGRQAQPKVHDRHTKHAEAAL